MGVKCAVLGAVDRSLFLMALCAATGGSVFLENPSTSLMFETKYFRWFVKALRRVGLRASCLLSVSMFHGILYFRGGTP